MGDYRVILADPPWEGYRARNYGERWFVNKHDPSKVATHYQTMTIRQLEGLPVSELASENAALFMWTVSTKLPQAIKVMEAWGFEYVTAAFCWTKMNQDGTPFRGLGAYTKQNIELCLLGKRGSPSRYRKARNVSQVFLTHRREHSRKPDEQYDRIMRLFDGPYLELFARQQWPGWDVWGNEAGKFPAQTFLIPEQMLEAAS